MSEQVAQVKKFSDFSLSKTVLQALADVGYEKPSPIQELTIPLLLEGKDLVGQAQTGTGKTAAFSLPMLTRLKPGLRRPQALILAPTRELAIQVAEAIKRYAAHMPGLEVLAIYGGQAYGIQMSALKRGVDIVVGTPGRVMDHIEKKTLDLSSIHYFVLDEADEMLNMGFIDDVEWVMERMPKERQTVLFSATMPGSIQNMVRKHLKNPEKISIKSNTATATTIKQRFMIVRNDTKLETLSRILETETIDAAIVFVRTKQATQIVADKLKEYGYRCAALSGDVEQKQRERTIELLKAKRLDIIIATDVAARGLDVDRISHVINYDIPFNTESYIHRIGRTGRAGREGQAILLISKMEMRHLKIIERVTKQMVEPMDIPSAKDLNTKRALQFKEKITSILASKQHSIYLDLVNEYCQENNVEPNEVAAAIAKMHYFTKSLFASEEPPRREREEYRSEGRRDYRSSDRGDFRGGERGGDRGRGGERDRSSDRSAAPRRIPGGKFKKPMCSYQIKVGHAHGVRPGQIVGAIANEASISSEMIGNIRIHGDFSTVDLPKDLSPQAISILQKVWVAGQQLKLSKME